MTAAYANVSVHAEPLAVWKIVLAVCLAIGSAISAGLTLGFMTMDLVQLKVLMNAEDTVEDQQQVRRQRQYARAVYPLRAKGTLLLITLLMTNVGVNAAFSILLGDVTSGLVGFFLSTSVLTVFGEILPQAVCSRYALPICYWFIPFVFVLEGLLLPLAWPLSKILDAFLGKELGVVYTRDQLSFLLHHHGSEAKVLNPDELLLLEGTLRLHRLQAWSVMIPLSRVFGLRSSQVFDKVTLARVVSSGYSRFPVFKTSDHQSIHCFLHLKDLALLNPKHYISVGSSANLFGRHLVCAKKGIGLLKLLTVFKDGRSRISLIVDDRDTAVGIVTMEDIFHQILQNNPEDEFSPAIDEETGATPQLGDPVSLCYNDSTARDGSMFDQTVPLEPSMSFVRSKILSRRLSEDDTNIRKARLQLLTESLPIKALTWEQCYVVHTFLLRHSLGFIFPPIDQGMQERCLRLVHDCPIRNYSPYTPLDIQLDTICVLPLKGYLIRCDSAEIIGSWYLLYRDPSLSYESVTSISTEDTKDWSPTNFPASCPATWPACSHAYMSGEEGCTMLVIDRTHFRETYGSFEA